MIYISHHYKFVYVELPGSEDLPMVEILASVDPQLVNGNGQPIQKRCFPFSWSAKSFTRPNYETFSIVRNPYEKMVFLYETTKPRVTFEQFVEHHEPSEIVTEHIVRFEHFERDMEKIAQRFGFSCHLFSTLPETNDYQAYYTPTIREIVFQKFKNEIERFRYQLPDSVIPNVVYQAYSSETDALLQLHSEMRDVNYDMEFKLFPLDDCEKFLIEHYPTDVVEAFRTLLEPAMKIQLWSYCILYKYGGIYLDPRWKCNLKLHNFLNSEQFVVARCDELVSTSPFEDMERLNDPIHFAYDLSHHTWENSVGLFPGFFVVKPQNETLGQSIQVIVRNVQLFERGSNYEYVTGAGVLGDCYTGDENRFEFFMSRTDSHVISATDIILTEVIPSTDSMKQAWSDRTLFKKKNLLVTGGCGFIGSNFINYIFPKNHYRIYNIDAMYYCASETNIQDDIRNDPEYHFIRGNICSVDLIDFILKKHNIEQVIHFAAQSHVQSSFDDSLPYTMDNVLGTHTLLECCRKYGKVSKFVHVSTDEVYGESMNDIHEAEKTEQSILCPTNPYAATKAGAELIAQSYQHSYKMPIIITRGNNVYGDNQYPEKLIPKFIQHLQRNQKVPIQGNGTSVRAFLHAKDTARAFERILCLGKIGEIYNIGSQEEYSVLEIARILIESIKKTKRIDEWIEYVKDRPFNDQRYYISNEKLRNLGWSPQIDFLDGLHSLL